jgi:hypothetical protein
MRHGIKVLKSQEIVSRINPIAGALPAAAGRPLAPGGARGCAHDSFQVARLLTSDGGALAAPAPPALLSRFLAGREGAGRALPGEAAWAGA